MTSTLVVLFSNISALMFLLLPTLTTRGLLDIPEREKMCLCFFSLTMNDTSSISPPLSCSSSLLTNLISVTLKCNTYHRQYVCVCVCVCVCARVCVCVCISAATAAMTETL